MKKHLLTHGGRSSRRRDCLGNLDGTNSSRRRRPTQKGGSHPRRSKAEDIRPGTSRKKNTRKKGALWGGERSLKSSYKGDFSAACRWKWTLTLHGEWRPNPFFKGGWVKKKKVPSGKRKGGYLSLRSGSARSGQEARSPLHLSGGKGGSREKGGRVPKRGCLSFGRNHRERKKGPQRRRS